MSRFATTDRSRFATIGVKQMGLGCFARLNNLGSIFPFENTGPLLDAMDALLGYLVDAAVGGVFLVARWIERHRATVELENDEAEAETRDGGGE